MESLEDWKAEDLRKHVQKVLVSSWHKLYGQEPSGGGWFPDDKTQKWLVENIKTKVVLDKFLADSVAAWILRLRNMKDGSKPKFFINSILTSEKNVLYVAENQPRIKSVRGSSSGKFGFYGRVYSSVYIGEESFNSGPHDEAPQMSLVTPTLYWVLFSVLYSRMGKIEWEEWGWDQTTTDIDSRRMYLRNAFLLEKKSLKSSSKRLNLVIEASNKATNDALSQYLVSRKIFVVLKDPLGHIYYKPAEKIKEGNKEACSELEMMAKWSIHTGMDLKERDKAVREAMTEILGESGAEIDKLNFSKKPKKSIDDDMMESLGIPSAFDESLEE